MKNYPGTALIILCLAVIFTAGCMDQTVPVSTPTPTPTPVPVTTTPLIVPTTLPDATTVPISIPVTTRPPPADPTDVSRITFLRYSDSDFSVDYPSPWIITHATYTPYYCQNVFDTSRSDYHICFENETRFIGPFNFYENDNLKKQSRIVTFTSADGTLKFVSFTSDFINSMNRDGILNSSMEWAINEYGSRYPDLAPTTHITNYRFFKSDNILASTFDVRLPESTHYQPAAYTEKAVVTLHHRYTFAFMTDTENFDTYRDLKERIISSIKVNDIV